MRPDEGEEKASGAKGRRLAVLGLGSCGRNLIHHLDEKFGSRDMEVMMFQRRALNRLDPGCFRKISWDDEGVDGCQLSMGERFERIDDALLEVEELIYDFDVLILAAGLGGLTGSYGVVQLSQLIGRSRTKVIAFVVMPFKGERPRKFDPQICVADLEESCDVVVVASNDRLLDVAPHESINVAFNRTRSLLHQIVRKMLDAGPENGPLVIDDPDRLAEIRITDGSREELKGMRLRHATGLRTFPDVRMGKVDREPLYQEYDEVYAKNDTIIAALKADLRSMTDFLVDEINKSKVTEEEEIDRREHYRIIRALLVAAFDEDQISYHWPLSLSGDHPLMEEIVLHLGVIDVVVERLKNNVSNGPELAQNIKRYVEDYLRGMMGIVDTEPWYKREKLEEHLPELHRGLREELVLRAGVIDTSDFDDDRLVVSFVQHPERNGEWGRL